MAWRTVVIESRAKLDYKMNSLVIRIGDEIKKIYIGDIQTLILESTAISLTCVLLNALIKAKVKVIFCDDKRFPTSELVPLHGAHNSSKRIREQINWDSFNKAKVWTEIVRCKIMNQAKLLASKQLEEVNRLYTYLDELELNDPTQREGHAAKVYFNALFGVDFSREQDNAINSALNYGYTILLSAVNREITASGYISELGLCHCNQFNSFNLGSDLVEPLRAFVDEWVVHHEPQELSKDVKHGLIELLEKTVIINGNREVLSSALRLYCRSVFRALQEGDERYINFIQFYDS